MVEELHESFLKKIKTNKYIEYTVFIRNSSNILKLKKGGTRALMSNKKQLQ